MRRASVDARVARVAALRREAELEADLRRHAAVLGIPVAELRAEAEEVTRMCRAAGAFILDACIAVVADDLGVTPESRGRRSGACPGPYVRSLDGRVARLTARVPPGFAVCRAWCGTVLIDDEGATTRPDRCPDCGRRVPVRTLVHIVGVDLGRV